jgi:hypothetical protein
MTCAAGFAARPRHRQRQEQLAIRKSEHHPMQHQIVQFG